MHWPFALEISRSTLPDSPTESVTSVCPLNGLVNIFRLIKMIDPNAFVSQSAVIGVYGEGFDEMRVKIKQQKNES